MDGDIVAGYVVRGDTMTIDALEADFFTYTLERQSDESILNGSVEGQFCAQLLELEE